MPAPTLLLYLAQEVVKPIIWKGVFSAEHVFFGDYMPRALSLYETGAVLGYTFRYCIATFAKLFAEPGRESELASHLGDPAASRLQGLPEPPNDFIDLFFKPEATRVIQVLQRAGLTTCFDWSDFPKVAKQKLRLSDIFSQLQFATAEGTGFGTRYPELTERLLTYQPDAKTWSWLRSHGLDIPASPPKTKTIDQRQAEARSLITPYVSAMRPELLTALGL